MKNRISTVVRPVASIRLHDASNVRMYTVIRHTRATMLQMEEPEELKEVPATAKCESTFADGLYTHRITYRIGQPGAELLEEYIRLTAVPGVVVFRDRSGVTRVIGSPSYPARLEVADSATGAQVSITAKSRYPALLYRS